MKLILASTSVHRQKILHEAHIPFTAMAPLEDEEEYKQHLSHLSVSNQALELARLKARKLSKHHPDALVLGADQICEYNKTPLNKPKTATDVIEQLILLSGKIIYLRTALSVMKNGEEVFYCLESPSSHYKKFDTSTAKEAVKNSEEAGFQHIGIAGAFPLESPFVSMVIEKTSGNLSTIIGMPIQNLIQFLEKENIRLKG